MWMNHETDGWAGVPSVANQSSAVPILQLEIEKEEMKGTVKAMPQREDITLPIDEQLIVELYSR